MNLEEKPSNVFAVDFSGVELLFNKLAEFFGFVYTTYLSDTIGPFLPFIKGMLNISSVLFLAGIIFVLFKINRVVKEDSAKYSPVDTEEEEKQKSKIEWEIILNHLNSQNQAEWKLAIIEADSMLDEILKEVGYVGETLADRLKEAGNGEVIQQAWEAHKVRNMIAHKGGTELTYREAKRVVGLYENVFKKFGYI